MFIIKGITVGHIMMLTLPSMELLVDSIINQMLHV